MAGRPMAAADLPAPIPGLLSRWDMKEGLGRCAACAQCMPGCRCRPLVMLQLPLNRTIHAGARTFWNCCSRYSACPERWASS